MEPNNNNTACSSVHANHCHHISWKAIFSGVIVALSIATLLNILGIALGFAVFSPDINTITHIGGGSAVWLSLTGIISMFLGGWVAGKLSGFHHSKSSHLTEFKLCSMLHGFLTWGASTLLLCILAVTMAGSVITIGASTLTAKNVSLQTMYQNDQANLQQNQVAITSTPGGMQVTSMSNEQLQQKAKEAANAMAAIACVTFIALLLGAIAGVIGGCMGGCSRCPRVGSGITPDNKQM